MTRANRRLATVISALVVLSFAIAQASDQIAKRGESRNVSLPSQAVLDEHAEPVLSSNGKFGFVASVTGGTVMSFSLASGKILSSAFVGETLGPISVVEGGGRRLIAVAAVNDPGRGNPAAVTVLDATNPKRLEMKALLMLPRDALITQATPAFLTSDGRFCLVASSFDVPTLISFEVETGQPVSYLPLIGRPSELALFDNGNRRRLAIASSISNTLSIIHIDALGHLRAGESFSPGGASLDISNNPAFSPNGRTIYIASSSGDKLFAVDVESGIQLDSLSVSSPQRVAAATGRDGNDLIACARIRRPANGKSGGVTIVANTRDGLATKSEFSPPDGIDFSRSNNVAFSADASLAFVGSASGVLFSFSTESGELASYENVGSELRRIAVGSGSRTVAAIRSAPTGDQVVIIEFESASGGELNQSGPAIDTIFPKSIEQGRSGNVQITVAVKNLVEGASILLNDVEYAADITPNGKALVAKLPKSLFDEVGPVSVRVKAADGSLSSPHELCVVRPGAPVIQKISPSEVPGPAGSFLLRVTGKNFRPSSTISVDGRDLSTRQIEESVLEARVSADLASSVGTLRVRVRDLSVSDLPSSEEKSLVVYGPRITAVKPSVNEVVAGDRRVSLSISGKNFRDGIQVVMGGETVAADRVRRVSGTRLTVDVPRELVRESGNLSVLVRNPDGGASASSDLPVQGPEITRFQPRWLFAGSADVAVSIRGKNFRPQARVYIGDGAGLNFAVERENVRFHDSTRIVVTLTGELNRLLNRPSKLKFQVVNPNGHDGVRSEDRAIAVLGPRITGARFEAVDGNDSQLRLVIDGLNFRQGAIVELFKRGIDNAPVSRLEPIDLTLGRMAVVIGTRRLERLGSFGVRVVNPGATPVPSVLFQPRMNSLASGK